MNTRVITPAMMPMMTSVGSPIGLLGQEGGSGGDAGGGEAAAFSLTAAFSGGFGGSGGGECRWRR